MVTRRRGQSSSLLVISNHIFATSCPAWPFCYRHYYLYPRNLEEKQLNRKPHVARANGLFKKSWKRSWTASRALVRMVSIWSVWVDIGTSVFQYSVCGVQIRKSMPHGITSSARHVPSARLNMRILQSSANTHNTTICCPNAWSENSTTI